MSYAVELLENALREERMRRGSADEYLRVSGFSTKRPEDIEAFEKSRDLAKDRITDLELAIKVLIHD